MALFVPDPDYCLLIHDFGNCCNQIFHLVLYIVGYTVRNFVLRQRAKHDFRLYIRLYTQQMCIQIFHLGRYIFRYTVRNFVSRQCVKHDF